MELRVLRYFLTVVREESITRAAEILHITQPTLSRQLSQMEEEIGVKLIHSLINAGLDIEEIRRFMKLFYDNEIDKKEQIQILRKQRFSLLDEIHKKQQLLDELDYMIDGLKKGGQQDETSKEGKTHH